MATTRLAAGQVGRILPTRPLHVTSPLQHGPDVLRVQERLLELGYGPGPLDGVYGPATATAVRAFERATGLAEDGTVGPVTLAALASASPPPPPDAPGAGVKALEAAVTRLGVTESPPRSNHTPFGVWFGVDGVPWCSIFLSWCFATGAGVTLCAGFQGPGCTAQGCAYVPTVEAWLRASGLWLGRVRPLPGDIAVYNWQGGLPDHVGIVEAATATGFTAIEGNTSVGDDVDGGRVLRRSRTLADVDGFGRL